MRLLMLSNYILLCCAFVAVETRQHPLPGIGSQCAGLPCVANGIIVATLSMVPRWRLYRYVRLCVCSLVVCWLPMVLSCVRRQYTYTHSGSAVQKHNTACQGMYKRSDEKNAIHARIYARKPSNKVRSNASRTSKRRVSGCLGISLRRNELF